MLETQTFTGLCDGHSIVPNQPLQLEPGRRIRVQIEILEEAYPLTRILSLADDLGVADLADRHTEYAHSLQRESKND